MGVYRVQSLLLAGGATQKLANWYKEGFKKCYVIQPYQVWYQIKGINWEGFHIEWFSFPPVTPGPLWWGTKNANSDPLSGKGVSNGIRLILF
jgi:hypothetical protein